MRKRKNRRTLKKRIKRAMSLTAFTTVLFLGGFTIYLIFIASKFFAVFQAEAVSNVIQKDINSGRAVKSLGIEEIGLMDKYNPKIKMWFEEMDKNTIIYEFMPYSRDINQMYITIEVNGNIVYTNEEEVYEELEVYYKDTEVVKPILNSEEEEIGSISVRVNPELILSVIAIILVVIILLSISALIIAKILSLFLTIPIINPIKQLEKKVKAIAEDDHETAVSTQIVLKKPLREMESLADSTNDIMKKLSGYNELLENQKDVLENQNAELEAQNTELMESKVQIQKQQAQLIQSEKMASVGLLTAAITHEINTPIGAINSNAQIEEMLLNSLQEHPMIQSSEELSAFFEQLKELNEVNLVACSRIMEIIKSLKSYSRLDQAEFQEANINESIKSVLVLTKNLLKRRITVYENYGDIPLVKCFPGQLNQVFMNIIVNASQAIEGEGKLFIQTSQVEDDIIIKIMDTGTGIKEEDIPKIFDPGFTTKGVGVGLGLGLYISYNIIQNHNGEISVASEPNMGTEFTIKIPINHQRT